MPFREDNRSTFRIGSPQIIFYKGLVAWYRLFNLFNHISIKFISETCSNRITSKTEILYRRCFPTEGAVDHMLKWNDNCYIGKTVTDTENIRRRLEEGKIVPEIYLLTLSDNPRNLMEILPAVSLVQRSLADLCPEIIGIAAGKEEAFQLTEDIVREVYEETGGVQIREYLKNR